MLGRRFPARSLRAHRLFARIDDLHACYHITSWRKRWRGYALSSVSIECAPTSRQTRRSAQHRRGVARFEAWRVLEIPCTRLPAHLQDRRGSTTMRKRFRLTFVCGEPGCDRTAVVLYHARPAETLEQLRQRNPIFLAVLCDTKHSGNYPASAAIDITVLAPSK